MRVVQYLMHYPSNVNVKIKEVGGGELYNGILAKLNDPKILNASFFGCNVERLEDDGIRSIEIQVPSEELQKSDNEPVWESWEQFFVNDKDTFHNMFIMSLRNLDAYVVDDENSYAYKQRKKIEEFYQRYSARLEMEFQDITGRSLTEASRQMVLESQDKTA